MPPAVNNGGPVQPAGPHPIPSPPTALMVLTETPPLTRADETVGVTLVRLRRLLDVSVALNTLGDTGRLLEYIAQTTCTVW